MSEGASLQLGWGPLNVLTRWIVRQGQVLHHVGGSDVRVRLVWQVTVVLAHLGRRRVAVLLNLVHVRRSAVVREADRSQSIEDVAVLVGRDGLLALRHKASIHLLVLAPEGCGLSEAGMTTELRLRGQAHRLR